MQKVTLTKEDCYCGIEEFYKKVAVALGANPDIMFFDCRKICVTRPVRERIFAWYEEQGVSTAGITYQWICYGPKANLPGDGYNVTVEDGFMEETIPMF